VTLNICNQLLRVEGYYADYVLDEKGIYKITFLSGIWKGISIIWPFAAFILGGLALGEVSPNFSAVSLLIFPLFFVLLYGSRVAGWLIRRRKAAFYAGPGDQPLSSMSFAKFIPWSDVSAARIRRFKKSPAGAVEFRTTEGKGGGRIAQLVLEPISELLRAKLGERLTIV
jgi:hypothetical protein